MRKKEVSLLEMISGGTKLKDLGVSEGEQKKYHNFVQMVVEQKRASENKDFVSFFSDFIRKSGFLEALLAQQDSATALAKLETLFDEIKKEYHSRGVFGFSEFITYLNTLKEHGIRMNVSNPMTPGVQLITFHGSKGLEFDTVYIARALKKKSVASEISLPFDDFSDGDVEDERRLLYVAITRAKKNCLMSSYVYNQEGKEQSRSIHLNEIDELPHIDMTSWEEEHSSDFADFFGESQPQLTSLIDQQYIQERFLKSNLSVSALNNYLESPLLYFFRNLVLLPQARSPFLDFGNLIHGTLELYFQGAVEQGSIPDMDFLKGCFQKVLDANPGFDEYEEKAWKTLESYVEHYRDSFTIPLENEFRVPVVVFESDSGHSINLTGVIDKITKEEDGSITVWDYKTGRSYSSMDKARREKTKRQAVFYKLLLQNAFAGKYNPSKVVFDFVEIAEKTGEYEHQEYEITQDDVEELKREINQLVENVFSGNLLKEDFSQDSKNRELLEFLEVLKGPRTYEQPPLI
jgi:DNA helicase-2/ATP-dependent DNA helicase PcrA